MDVAVGELVEVGLVEVVAGVVIVVEVGSTTVVGDAESVPPPPEHATGTTITMASAARRRQIRFTRRTIATGRGGHETGPTSTTRVDCLGCAA